MLNNEIWLWKICYLLPAYKYKILKEKEPENPVVYLTKIVKKLDVKNRNGIVALIIINLSVILLFKFYLKGTGLLTQ